MSAFFFLSVLPGFAQMPSATPQSATQNLGDASKACTLYAHPSKTCRCGVLCGHWQDPANCHCQGASLFFTLHSMRFCVLLFKDDTFTRPIPIAWRRRRRTRRRMAPVNHCTHNMTDCEARASLACSKAYPENNPRKRCDLLLAATAPTDAVAFQLQRGRGFWAGVPLFTLQTINHSPERFTITSFSGGSCVFWCVSGWCVCVRFVFCLPPTNRVRATNARARVSSP